jgi:hypothetical protein
MTLISASELAAIQSVALSGMTSTATILTRTTVVTADGQESVWATNGDDVPCWVYQATPLGGTLGAISGAVGISQTFSIRVPIGSDVNSGDHLAVGGLIYNVEQTNDESTYPAWLVCGCRVVE